MKRTWWILLICFAHTHMILSAVETADIDGPKFLNQIKDLIGGKEVRPEVVRPVIDPFVDELHLVKASDEDLEGAEDFDFEEPLAYVGDEPENEALEFFGEEFSGHFTDAMN